MDIFVRSIFLYDFQNPSARENYSSNPNQKYLNSYRKTYDFQNPSARENRNRNQEYLNSYKKTCDFQNSSARENRNRNQEYLNLQLIFESSEAKSLDDETFANFFLGDRHLELIILNCCRSATVSPNQAMKGTISNLVRRRIPVTIAMQYIISDSTAKLFASEFYKTRFARVSRRHSNPINPKRVLVHQYFICELKMELF